MSIGIALLIGIGVGVVVTMAAFIYLNRTKPDQVDKVEEAARTFKFPGK